MPRTKNPAPIIYAGSLGSADCIGNLICVNKTSEL
ncbi:MAG: hypothetical protein ACJA2O_004543, partial [Candidatus Azotimanducaceae bacterium]